MDVYYRMESGDLNEIAEEARRAEALGFDGYSSYDQNHDPFFPLVMAAGVTKTVTLETRTLIAYPRSPTAVAYAAWDLQAYSRGRFKLGMSTQVKAQVERRFAARWLPAPGGLREYIEALHAVWDCWEHGIMPNYQGEYYTVTVMPESLRPAPMDYGFPPLYIGGMNPKTCQLAGELADGLMVQTLNSPTFIRKEALPSLMVGARKVGRSRNDLRINGGALVVTAGNKQELADVKEQARLRVAFYASYSPAYKAVFAAHGWADKQAYLMEVGKSNGLSEVAREIDDEMLGALAVIGEYDEIGGLVKEKYGGLIDEISFTFYRPPLNRQQEDELLSRIIRDLKS